MSKKVKAGEPSTVTTLEDAPSDAGANNVVDLTELPAKSLARRKPGRGVDRGTRSAADTTKKALAKTPIRRRA